MVIKSKVKHKKTPHHIKDHHTQELDLHNLAIGAAAFCLVGAAAATGILVAKKRRSSGWERAYDQLTSAADDYAHEAYEKGHDVYESARDALKNAAHLFDSEENHTSRNVILGILGAGLLGATAYYASQNKNVDYEGFAKRNLHKWGDIGKSVIDTVTDNFSNSHEKNVNQSPIQNIIDVASFGINLWQELKKRG